MNPVRSKSSKKSAGSSVVVQPANRLNKAVALKPKVSEKTYALSEAVNTYVFEVSPHANKHDISQAVSSQYQVTVINVRVASIPGKPKRSVRRGGRNIYKGARGNTRKAYVTLIEGDKLPIFSAIEEANQPPEAK